MRTPAELVRHMTSVLGYAWTFFVGGTYRPEPPESLSDEVDRFHEMLESLSGHLDDAPASLVPAQTDAGQNGAGLSRDPCVVADSAVAFTREDTGSTQRARLKRMARPTTPSPHQTPSAGASPRTSAVKSPEGPRQRSSR